MPQTPDPQTADLHATIEKQRLADPAWQVWGPYLAERQWGTVREDYSAHGDAWAYFPHDHARSRAYRWSEDGIAGFSDDKQHWCLALALWNGVDPILKERMFGLTNEEGNHGEDVKELYWYLDGTPTHSYMRMLYKYPQGAFPYDELVEESARRKGKNLPENELIDTGLFDEDRYFDIAVDYAKASPDDILMRVVIDNRGPEAALLHVLPHLWARNSWSWDVGAPRPSIVPDGDGHVIATREGDVARRFEALQQADFLFCENDTNDERLFGRPNAGLVKDGINNRVVEGDISGIGKSGTKCAAWTQLDLASGEQVTLRFRFAPANAAAMDAKAFDALFATRIAEADAFYAKLQQGIADPDARLVQRQALAGMLWSKQYYAFDVRRWLAGDQTQPPPPSERRLGRDGNWLHLHNADIISMPDTWEYPWYAAWDLAFHCVTFALIDPAFAKKQLLLLTTERYMSPNGQLPAYEWAFGDVNPPVQAWAALRIYRMELAATGQGDLAFLERVLHKLMLNFTWWVNREDVAGHNVFQGGFLGLDNIGVFDRSKPLPTGGYISQADGTAWMAMYALDLMRIALELSLTNPVYEDVATKFFDHFLLIAEAMTDIGDEEEETGVEKHRAETGLWDEQDGFYYDMLNLDDGSRVPLRVRSLVGLIPLCVVEVLSGRTDQRHPAFAERLRWTLANRPDLAQLVSRWNEPGKDGRMLLSLLRATRMTRLLGRMLDEGEFLSDHGVRSVSKIHATQPYTYDAHGTRFAVDYEPGESTTTMFGGNSNWRGPVWMPINYMLVEALYEFEAFYGKDIVIELPTGSGHKASLVEVACELTSRLTRLFLKGADGRRPVLGDNRILQEDPHFRDLIPFHEYFHGETGAGLGAMHQTGWTGLVALLLQPRVAAE